MKNKILIGIVFLSVIGLVVAQSIDNVIKETSNYKITNVTLDGKEALHFELKKEVLATDLIKEAIEIQEERKGEKEDEEEK